MKKLTEIITSFKTSAPSFVNTIVRIRDLIRHHQKDQNQTQKEDHIEKIPVQEVLPQNHNLYDLCPKLLDVDMNAVHEELKEGDLVYAAMPYSMERLEQIEPSHRIRPYAVVRKTRDGFIGYPLSSGYLGRNSKQAFRLTPEEYNVSRECYVILERAHVIIKDHISNIIDHLNVQDQLRMNMIINAHNITDRRHPRFTIHKQIRVNSIVTQGRNYYYIYSLEADKASVLPMTKERTETPVNYCNELWYIDRTQRRNVILDNSYSPAGELTRSVHNRLAEFYKHRKKTEEGMAKRRQKTPSFEKTYALDYAPGAIVQRNDTKYIYAFSSDRKVYGFAENAASEKEPELVKIGASALVQPSHEEISRQDLQCIIANLISRKKEMRWMESLTFAAV